ncbi:MAG TPA: hypothetical protein VE136_02615, partial [Anaerolineales bacterium]|nr:hypothetical protein [Anaerolineales bacterium]
MIASASTVEELENNPLDALLAYPTSAPSLFKSNLYEVSDQASLYDQEQTVSSLIINRRLETDASSLASILFRSVLTSELSKYLYGVGQLRLTSLPGIGSQWRASSEAASIEDESSTDIYQQLTELISREPLNPNDLEIEMFEQKLREIMLQTGSKAIHYIDRLIDTRTGNEEVIFDTLRFLGRIQDPNTNLSRLRLLIKQLDNPSRWIRDGASLGLASLK